MFLLRMDVFLSNGKSPSTDNKYVLPYNRICSRERGLQVPVSVGGRGADPRFRYLHVYWYETEVRVCGRWIRGSGRILCLMVGRGCRIFRRNAAQLREARLCVMQHRRGRDDCNSATRSPSAIDWTQPELSSNIATLCRARRSMLWFSKCSYPRPRSPMFTRLRRPGFHSPSARSRQAKGALTFPSALLAAASKGTPRGCLLTLSALRGHYCREGAGVP